MSNLYLILDAAAIAGPVALSFDRKVSFISNWKYVFLAAFIIAIPFLVWDAYFTSVGIWGFNDNYLVGTSFLGLPIEEVLFFIVVPFSCTFIYECCKHYISTNKTRLFDKVIMSVLVLYTFVMMLPNLSHVYTLSAGLSFIMIVLIWVGNKQISHVGPTFIFSMIPFFIMNGILTGYLTEEPVVWYNDAENTGMRIGTIPVEDVIYGSTLIFSNIFLYEWIKRKWSK